MSRKYVAGPDIDLDVEFVKDKKGRRIIERRAQAITGETLAKAGVGRPSLIGPGPLPRDQGPGTRGAPYRLAAAARDRVTTCSTLIREALERYLAS